MTLKEKFKKHSWWMGSLAAIVIFFGVRIFCLVDVTAPINTKEGMVQGERAYRKIVRYNDLAGRRVKKGGFLKSIVLWPIKPTEKEVEYANKYLSRK